ncbi:MAG: hypothetical protein CL503_00580 [Actinobacteria bacterium]|nr:hypothetical protein [Actinomycetota bacterium]
MMNINIDNEAAKRNKAATIIQKNVRRRQALKAEIRGLEPNYTPTYKPTPIPNPIPNLHDPNPNPIPIPTYAPTPYPR